MQIFRDGESFKPVHIILENQDEVDLLYGIFNYAPLLDAFDNENQTAASIAKSLYHNLLRYKGPNADKFFQLIDRALTCV